MKSNERNSSIELLRIIAMMGVIILHYNNVNIGGGLKFVSPNSINQYFVIFSEVLSICAVNLFIMISAYFLCDSQKRKFNKIAELLIQVIVFYVAQYVLSCIMGKTEFSMKQFIVKLLPANYFVILYSVLYIISPYINILVHNLSKENFKRLIIIAFVLFSVETFAVDYIEAFCGDTMGLSAVGCYGSEAGYTIVNFILVYLIGSYIRIYGAKDISKKKIGISILITYMILYAMALVEQHIGLSYMVSWNYNNPIIIIITAFLVLYFTKINFNSKLINELAKGSFTCFLFHGYLLKYLKIQTAVQSNIFILIIHQLLSAFIIYLISYVVYKIYSLCTKYFFEKMASIFNKINISVEN